MNVNANLNFLFQFINIRKVNIFQISSFKYENIISYFSCCDNNFRFVLLGKIISIRRIFDSNRNWFIFFDF